MYRVSERGLPLDMISILIDFIIQFYFKANYQKNFIKYAIFKLEIFFLFFLISMIFNSIIFLLKIIK